MNQDIDFNDCLEILKLDKFYTQKTLEKNYALLISKHHPDNGGNISSFNIITEAYNLLKIADRESRQENRTRNIDEIRREREDDIFNSDFQNHTQQEIQEVLGDNFYKNAQQFIGNSIQMLPQTITREKYDNSPLPVQDFLPEDISMQDFNTIFEHNKIMYGNTISNGLTNLGLNTKRGKNSKLLGIQSIGDNYHYTHDFDKTVNFNTKTDSELLNVQFETLSPQQLNDMKSHYQVKPDSKYIRKKKISSIENDRLQDDKIIFNSDTETSLNKNKVANQRVEIFKKLQRLKQTKFIGGI